MTNKEKIAYLAALIDGEGCIDIPAMGKKEHYSYGVRLSIVNTNKDLMEWLQDNFGGDVQYRKQILGWKQSGVWRIQHKKAVELLERVYPFLIVKDKQALTASALMAVKETASYAGFGKGYSQETKDAIALCRDEISFWNKKGEHGQVGFSPMELVLKGI